MKKWWILALLFYMIFGGTFYFVLRSYILSNNKAKILSRYIIYIYIYLYNIYYIFRGYETLYYILSSSVLPKYFNTIVFKNILNIFRLKISYLRIKLTEDSLFVNKCMGDRYIFPSVTSLIYSLLQNHLFQWFFFYLEDW